MCNPEGIGSRGLKSDRKGWILTGGIGGGMWGLLSTDHTEFKQWNILAYWQPKKKEEGWGGDLILKQLYTGAN